MQKILVVDDEPSIGKALKMGLSSNEITVDVAESGQKGVELGIANPYDVLIVDLCLTDIGGLEVIEKIQGFSPAIVSIVITGNPGKKSLEKAGEQKVAAYLEKPLDMKTVKDAVRRGLEGRALKENER
jgi:DNA-binding NtrC family response regulator